MTYNIQTSRWMHGTWMHERQRTIACSYYEPSSQLCNRHNKRKLETHHALLEWLPDMLHHPAGAAAHPGFVIPTSSLFFPSLEKWETKVLHLLQNPLLGQQQCPNSIGIQRSLWLPTTPKWSSISDDQLRFYFKNM